MAVWTERPFLRHWPRRLRRLDPQRPRGNRAILLIKAIRIGEAWNHLQAPLGSGL